MEGEHRFYGTWNDNWKKKSDINLLEFYRIGLVRKVWSHTRNLKRIQHVYLF